MAEKTSGALCGGNREKAWKWINEAKTDEEYERRLMVSMMAII
jgi:hypothetical protein